ncbi:MAG: hypothetical protein R3345_08205 [Fulvivirga sp.]|nr:hypothetical protein [Fulvivirga sp.]
MASREHVNVYLPVIISAGLYILMGYFTPREDSFLLLTAYGLLFITYSWLLYKSRPCSVPHFILVGILFRMLLLFSLPSLSDDIYRFVWDGRLLLEGINPFDKVPSAYALANAYPAKLDAHLFSLLNSPDYFTIYPPFAQFVFWLSVLLSPDSILGSAVVMRLMIIFAEAGTIYFLLKLADHYNVPRKNVLLYVLNPLVILELTGNLHFEAFMIFFLVAAIYYFQQNKLFQSAGLYAVAIASKLIPLIFLPIWLRRVKPVRWLKFYTLIAIFVILTFLPLLGSGLWEGMGSSISLYFQKFEFNASVYYLIREIGLWIKGYNIIADAGPYLGIATFLLIILFALVKYDIKLPQALLWVLLIYFLLATTVHPWYVTTLVAVSVLTPYRFAVLWSFLIFFTYFGYHEGGYRENLWLVGIEYAILIVYILYEIYTKKNKKAGTGMDKSNDTCTVAS